MNFIQGDTFIDQRGKLFFVNDFNFPDIKRFYGIHHPDMEVFRAWQGHRVENKYFFAVRGSFRIFWIAIDHWEMPSKDLPISWLDLHEAQPAVLKVAAGHVNGIKSLEPDSTLMVFSDLSLEEGALDNIRFEPNYWDVSALLTS